MGSQHVSIRYSKRLTDASIGTVGDSYDNAQIESLIGLYKLESVRPEGPWHDVDHLELATLYWVHWFNHRRLLEPIGHIPPAEKEAAYYRAATESAVPA